MGAYCYIYALHYNDDVINDEGFYTHTLEEVAYWRKRYGLFGWFYDNVTKDNDDELHYYVLTDDILLKLIKELELSIKDEKECIKYFRPTWSYLEEDYEYEVEYITPEYINFLKSVLEKIKELYHKSFVDYEYEELLYYMSW